MIKLNEGDTLAIKIENYNKEFDGKYFLFIKTEDFIHILDLKHILMPRKIEKLYFIPMNLIIYILIYLNLTLLKKI